MKTNYMIFYTGCASTPNTVGLKNTVNNEVIHEVKINGDTGKEIRKNYDKIVKKLKKAYPNF